MKRWLLRILLALLVLVLLLLSGVAAIGLTESGTRWLVRQLQPLLPGELAYADLRGRLFDRIEIDGLSYRQQALQLEAGRIEFAWVPLALLQGRLQLDRVGVESLDLQLPPASQEPPPAAESSQEPLQLPGAIGLPLALQIGEVYGRDLRIRPAAGEPLIIDSVQLGLHSEEARLVLDRFEVSAPQGAIELHGDMTPAGDYPLALSLDWLARLPDYGELRGQGTLRGQLRGELVLTQELQGLAQARLEARVTEPLTTPAWQLALELIRFDPAPFAADLAGHEFSGRLDFSGDLASARGGLSLNGSVPEAGRVELISTLEASVEQLQLSDTRILLPDTGARVSAAGRITALQTAPELDLQLDWEGLRYPLPRELPAQFSSDSGQVQIQGPLQDYRLRLSAALAGEQIPESDLELEGQGNLDGFSALTLDIASLGGELRLDGNAGWRPQPAWKLRARASNIDPGRHWPDWTGSVGFELNSEGWLEDGKPRLQADIAALSGQLRGQPLSGTGQLRLSGTDLEIPQLALGWGNARLEASGRAGETLALNWRLQAPDLASLLPDTGGSISASGTLTGPRETPALQADISAGELAFQANRLQRLNGTLALDLGWKSPARIDMTASELQLGARSIDLVRLQGGGAQQDHALDLAVDAEDGSLALRLEGGLFDEQWRGRLTRLDLQQHLAGRWQLAAPVALELAADRARSEPLCLQAQDAEGRLCAEGQWLAAGDSNGDLELQRLPLSLLAPWLPAGAEVTGYLNGDARARLGASGSLDYDAVLSLDQTRLALPDEGLDFDLNRALASLEGSEERVSLTLDMTMDEIDGRLNAAVAVADPAGAGKLDGRVEMAMEDLRFLSVLVPAMKVDSGRLNGDFNIAGDLQQPRVRGALELNNGRVELPGAGIALEQLELALRDDPARPEFMLLEGSAASGGGSLELSGELQPLAQQGRLQIRGERFQAMGTPEIQVYISPDMLIGLSEGRIAVGGELVVPEALIKPPKLAASAVQVSPDAVIVGQEDAASRRGPALDLDLRLTLGEQVRVDAFGFDGRLTGSMVLREDERRVTRATGNIGVAAGQYELYGQDLEIERGTFVYTGGPVDNPGLDLRVKREVEAVTVGARVGGSLRVPTFELFSEPAMPDSSRLSYLIFGRAPGTASEGEQAMLMKLALALGRGGGNRIGEQIAGTLNVDEIGFGGGETLEDTSFYVGKYLSPRLYIKYGVGLLEPTNEFIMRYKLTERLSFESNTGTTGSGADIFYSFER